MATLGPAQMPLDAGAPRSASAVSAATITSRHSALVRVTHWITALCFLALLVSGVEIRDLSPALLLGRNRQCIDAASVSNCRFPASRDLVPTGYGYVLPDQNGWSRYLHFQAAWIAVLTGLLYAIYGLVHRAFPEKPAPRRGRSFVARALGRNRRPFALQAARRGGSWSYNAPPAAHLLVRDLRSVPVGHLDGPGDVPGFRFGVSGHRHSVGRPAIRAHDSFLRLPSSRALPGGPRRDDLRSPDSGAACGR